MKWIEKRKQERANVLEYFPEVKVLNGKLGGLEKPSTIQDVVTDIILR